MKPIIKFSSFLFLIGIVFYISCKKEDPTYLPGVVVPPAPPVGPGTNPPPSSSIGRIKATILEYGTNRPLSDANVDAISASGDFVYGRADSRGTCWLDASKISLSAISKAGYWDYSTLNSSSAEELFAPINLYPDTVLFDYANPYTFYACDSFVVKLFPKTTITLHVKDSRSLSTCSDCNIIFAANAIFNAGGNIYTVFHGNASNSNGNIIRLRPKIDTTFQCVVFGNTDNIFHIGEDDAANGWAGFSNFLHTETKYVSGSTNSIFNITF